MVDLNRAFSDWSLSSRAALNPKLWLLDRIAGSQSFGTALPDSDVDYMGVFLNSLRQVLSMTPPPVTIESHNPDFQAHEIGKFCALLMKGNPGIIESLFCDRWVWRSKWIEPLMDIRMDFINQKTLKQYLGYAHGQMQRLKVGTRVHSSNGEYNTKWAYHLIRLMMDAQRIAEGFPPVVYKTGEERRILMEIRGGKYAQWEVEDMYRDMVSEVESINLAIPEHASEPKVNELLYQLRMGHE